MKIGVCVKQVVARETVVRVDAGERWIREDGVTWTLNEPDAYALEEALRLKERRGGEVTAISAGPDRVVHVLRDCLARGADRAIRVDGAYFASADAATTADALATVCAREAFDLILTGLQSDDHGSASVGVILAERLGSAHATIVMTVEVTDTGLRVKRELEGGWSQWVTLPMPAVLTIQSGINPLRYATLKGVMASKKKEIPVVSVPPAPAQTTRILSVYVPDKQKKTRLISGPPAEAAAALVKALRDEGII